MMTGVACESQGRRGWKAKNTARVRHDKLDPTLCTEKHCTRTLREENVFNSHRILFPQSIKFSGWEGLTGISREDRYDTGLINRTWRCSIKGDMKENVKEL